MYLERKRLENGKYRYLVKCPDCPRERWIADIRSTDSRCRSCAKKARVLNFCRIYPCKCKHCSKAIILKTKPKIDGIATCDICKGKFGGKQASEEKVKKSKIKCSECDEFFTPRNSDVKTCSKTCSITRRKRVAKENRLKRIFVKPKIKPSKNFVDDKVVIKDKPLGGVDKKEKPIYIREREMFKFREPKINGMTNDELSASLIKKFKKNGGKPSVTFQDQKDFDCSNGQTFHTRVNYGY